MAATNSKCGSTGTVSLGGEITDWTLNLITDSPDATSMSSGGFKEYIACLKGADFTFTSLVPCGAIGAHASVTFTNDLATYTFDAIINDLGTSVDTAGVINFNYSGVATGAVTGF